MEILGYVTSYFQNNNTLSQIEAGFGFIARLGLVVFGVVLLGACEAGLPVFDELNPGQGSGIFDPDDPNQLVPTGPDVSLSVTAVPYGVPVDIDESGRTIIITNLRRDIPVTIEFFEDKKKMQDLLCSAAPSNLVILSNGFEIQPEILNSESLASELSIDCSTDHGHIEFKLRFNDSEMFNLSTVTGVGGIADSLTIGDNYGEWLVFRSSRYSVEGHLQIYAKHIETGELILISAMDGVPGDLPSDNAIVSKDGSIIIFSSNASNFPSANGRTQLYMRDMDDVDGDISLVSSSSTNQPGEGNVAGWRTKISSDGKQLLFDCSCANFPGAIAGIRQVYVKDLANLNLPLILVSEDSGGAGQQESSAINFSPDGSLVLFSSRASNFAGSPSFTQIYLKDLNNITSPPKLVSKESSLDMGTTYPSGAQFSPDGLKIIFMSQDVNLPGANTKVQIYLKQTLDLDQPIVLISGLDSTTAGSGASNRALFTPDSSKVIFETNSINFVASNFYRQIYSKDLSNINVAPVLVSGLSETFGGNGSSSYDVGFIQGSSNLIFTSGASNFAGANGFEQIYRKDMTDLSLPPVLLSGVGSLTAGNGNSGNVKILSKTSQIIFESDAANFTNSNGADQLYLKNFSDLTMAPILFETAKQIQMHAVQSISGAQLSPDGSKLLFWSSSPELPYANGNLQVYLKDLSQLMSQPQLVSGLDTITAGTEDSSNAKFSPDGGSALFTSNAENFPSNGQNQSQIYIKNLADLSQPPILVSGLDISTGGQGISNYAQFSPDGNRVVFGSTATNFVLLNSYSQIYVKDLTNLNQAPVLVSGQDEDVIGLGNSFFPQFSPDGQKVVFQSTAANFFASSVHSQIYTKDLTDLTMPPVLISGVNATTAGDNWSGSPQFSPDGTKMVFESRANNFVSGAGLYLQIYIKDLTNLSLIPVLISGIDRTTVGTNTSISPHFSPDGTSIVFKSHSSNFSQSNGFDQIYIKELSDLDLEPYLISKYLAAAGTNGHSSNPQFSTDGKSILFKSGAENLPSSNGNDQIYLVSTDDIN